MNDRAGHDALLVVEADAAAADLGRARVGRVGRAARQAAIRAGLR